MDRSHGILTIDLSLFLLLQITLAVVLLATATLGSCQLHPVDLPGDLLASPSDGVPATRLPPAPPGVKLDKNLRRALLKALVDLEAESAEQHQAAAATSSTDQPEEVGSTEPDQKQQQQQESGDDDGARYDFLEISKQKSASFLFDGFPGDDEPPSEDKLQNSSFVEQDKFVEFDGPEQPERPRPAPKDYTKGVQVRGIYYS